jgi:hypothetical protein
MKARTITAAAPLTLATSEPPDFAVQKIATILARGYLRLLARKVAPVASNGASTTAEIGPTGLDDVVESE